MSSSAAPGAGPRGQGFRLVLVMAALMWVAEIVDIVVGHRLDRLGIQPRDFDGLTGVIAAPFLHAGFGHLLANTVPFVAMGLAIALKGAVRVVIVTVIVGLVSGLGTWLLGAANSLHVGASGLVFGYATYLLTQGVREREPIGIAIAVAVVVVWGGVLLGGLLPAAGISWQGHLFGAIGGVVAARALSTGRPSARATG